VLLKFSQRKGINSNVGAGHDLPAKRVFGFHETIGFSPELVFFTKKLS